MMLTERQREVSQMMADGLTVKAAAHRLRVSPKTIEYHLRKVYERLRLVRADREPRVLLTRHVMLMGVEPWEPVAIHHHD